MNDFGFVSALPLVIFAIAGFAFALRQDRSSL